MYVYVCTYARVHVCTCVHVYMCTCVHVCVHNVCACSKERKCRVVGGGSVTNLFEELIMLHGQMGKM